MPINDKISNDLIDLEPTAVLEFYKLYYDTINEPDSFYPFHPCSHGIENSVILNDVSYLPIAVEVEDFETNAFNRISRPRIRISNANLNISQVLRRKNDFKYAKLERIKIFLKYIDDANFEGGINPFGVADPTAEINKDTYIISQKLQENKMLVEFELTAPFDLENFTIPGRLVLSRYCYWQYRGIGCNYFGQPVCQENDQAFTVIPTGTFNFQTSENEWNYGRSYNSGEIIYATTDKDPYRTWYVCKTEHRATENNHPSLDSSPWEKDGCSKVISSCRKRFSNTGINYTGYLNGVSGQGKTVYNLVPATLNADISIAYLPFGGFPATDKYQYGASYKGRK
jgi:lambda family phage minor tail protein L